MTHELPTRYHFIEPDMEPRLMEFIQAGAPRAWDELVTLPGGPRLCINALAVWPRIFAEAGEYCEPLGGWYQDGEGILLEHQYFAVGSGLWLFDPTAAQFSRERALVVERARYLVRPAEFSAGVTFEKWRSGRLSR